MTYADFFQELTGHWPHAWQLELGEQSAPDDRLIRIPTGFGKTAGVVSAWLYHCVHRRDPQWPRRLVFALPMRVLVEQTLEAARRWAGTVADGPRVYPLMGGLVDKEYAANPEEPAILVGTQDMLLSRALNRGYAAARGRWPVDFGLLHCDALWVLDEVQLMDVGLATSAQLAAFRRALGARGFPRAYTWWMSATLQPAWLRTIDWRDRVTDLEKDLLHIDVAHRAGGLWSVRKGLERAPDVATPAALAALTADRHRPGTLTLVVVNQVGTAQKTHTALRKATRGATDVDLRLVHSRFRPWERRAWSSDFLHRAARLPSGGRIVVATQVVEAGVDISARHLVTELAPWPSLVQRFGRCARYAGEDGAVTVVRPVPDRDQDALPYSIAELAAADGALTRLDDVAPASLEALEDELRAREPEELARLYPFAPLHVIREPDLLELFDTSPDLSGADLDVGRYIRAGAERNVHVLWRPIGDAPRTLSLADQPLPRREELCPVPIAGARKWLAGMRKAWRYDYLHSAWMRADLRRLVPGHLVLVAAELGGYTAEDGWTGKGSSPPPNVALPRLHDPFEETAAGADQEQLSVSGWKTIACHLRESGEEAEAIGRALGLPDVLREIVVLAARWHDLGKAHPVFQAAIRTEAKLTAFGTPAPGDLAKAPGDAWRRPAYPDRPGFRHELASALGLLDLLRQYAPDHPALGGKRGSAPGGMERPTLVAELAALDAGAFDLLLWLVATHHGKVRCSLASTPRDQDAAGMEEAAIHGVSDGDVLPSVKLYDASGAPTDAPSVVLDLGVARLGLHPTLGRSWNDRASRLLRRYGPFCLAYLEAVMRAADVRASQLPTEDPRL